MTSQIISQHQTLTASEARDNLYSLIKQAGNGLKTFEITLHGSNPVVLVNKAELDAWQETLDILSHKQEISSIRKARKQKTVISHDKLLKTLKI